MRKFYKRRYQLFKKFDNGILMDNESWFSVTPEMTANQIALKCFDLLKRDSNQCILDGFCGAGGNTIQFAHYFDHVISCDIDFVKLQCAQHNSNIYNVENKISFLIQDFFNLHKSIDLDKFKIDLVFLSPPWGK
jgi:tRNA/tmRNA/rRNA uracil-C5-methylase (TrmA/RlmC/RlmD family)